MKLLLFVVLFATGTTSLNAQEEIVDKAKLHERARLYKAAGKDTVKQKQFNVTAVPGERLRILPQDGMPCIVPDTADIAAMPNAWKGAKETATRPVPGQMPNAWQSRKKGVIAK